jgi:hypothetical protein
VDRTDNFRFARDKTLFERGAGWNGSEGRGHAHNRTIEVIESFLLSLRCDFGSDATQFNGFMDDDEAAGLLDRIHNRFDIKRR